MADGKIEIGIELDDSKAKKQGQKAGQDIAKGVESGLKSVGKSAESSAKDASKSFQNVADTAKSSFSDVGSAAKSGFSDVADSAKSAAGDASSAFEDVPSDAKGAFSDVSSEAESGFDGVADAANTAADDASDAFKRIPEGAEGAGEKVHEALAVKTVAAGNLVADAFEAAANKVIELGKQALDAGMSFDKSMSQVAATMGVSVEEVQTLRDFAQQMGESTAFSASEAADALNYMALAGYDAETSMRVLPTVLNLAAAGNMDLASASDMVTDAQSALGLSVEEAEVMVDQMAKASSKTNTSVDQLGSAFLTVGGTAKTLKGGTKELAQMLGILADNGVKGSEGGTALRNVILSLSAPTDKAAGAIKDLGLEVFDAEGNLRSMPEIFADLNKKIEPLTQEKRTQVLNEIFNKVDLKSVNALLGTSSDRFDDVAKSIDNAKGAAEQMAETQLDNLSGDLTLLESATEGLYIAISDKLSPVFRDFAKFATDDVMPFLTDMVNHFDRVVPYIGAFVAALVILGTKSKIMRILATDAGTMAAKLKMTTAEYKALTAAQKLSKVAANSMRGAMKNIATLALDVAIMAAVEAIAYFVAEAEKAKEKAEKLDKGTRGLEEAVLSVTAKVDDEAESISQLGSAVDDIDYDGMLDAHAELTDKIKDTTEEVQGNKALLDNYADVIDELGDKGNLNASELAKLEAAVQGVNDKCGTTYEVAGDAADGYYLMSDGAKVAKDDILKLVEAQKIQLQAEADSELYGDTYKQSLKDLEDLGKAKRKVAKLTEAAAKAEEEANSVTLEAGESWASYQQRANDAVYKQNDLNNKLEEAQKELDGIQRAYDSSSKAAEQYTKRTELDTLAQRDNASQLVRNAAVNDEYRSGVQLAGRDLVDFTLSLKKMGFTSDDVKDMSQEDAMAIAEAWGTNKEAMIKAVEEAGIQVPKKLQSMDHDAYVAAVRVGQSFGTGMSSSTKSVVDAVLSTIDMTTQEFEKAAEKYGIKGDDAALAFAEAIAAKDGDAEQAAKFVANASEKELENLHDSFKNSGINAVDGLIEGINYKAAEAQATFAKLVKESNSALKKAAGEHSPWKTTFKSGTNAALGLINGVKKHYPGVKKAGKTLAESIIQGANKRLSNIKSVYDVSAKYEEGYWNKVRKSVKKGSDAWYEATKNLRAAKKQQRDDARKANDQIITDAEKWLKRYKLTHDVSAKYEEKFWRKKMGKVKKFSDAYYDALEKAINAREKKLQEQQAKRDEKKKKAEEKRAAVENKRSATLEAANNYVSRQKRLFDMSSKQEESYWKKIVKKLKKGTKQYKEAYDNWLEARKRANEDKLNAKEERRDSIVSTANNYVSRQKRLFDMSAAQEEAYWKKILKKLKKGTKQYKEVYDNYLEARKNAAEDRRNAKEEQRDSIVSNANEYISRQRRLYTMSYQQEVDYWKKILKKLKKGTKQYKEVYDNYLEAKKNAAEELKEKNDELLDYEQEYVDKVRDIQSQLAEDIKAAKDAYLEAVAERKSAILSDMNLFEAYRKKVTISGEKLIENLRKQVSATKDYENGMKQLEKRIGKGELYDEIAGMGMEGLRYIESLNGMTDKEIAEFVRLYKERNAIAQREATRENEDLLKQTNKTIEDLNKQAKDDIDAATKELKTKASELGTALSKSIASMASNVKISANSISSSIDKALAKLKALDKRVTTTSTTAKTKSYAAQPQQVPIATVYNGRDVITDANGAVQGYTLLATDLYGPTQQTEVSLLKGMEALTMAMRDSNAIRGDQNFYQTNEFHSTVTSPDEFAREMRIQQHYGLAGQWL